MSYKNNDSYNNRIIFNCAFKLLLSLQMQFFNNVLWCRYPRCTDREAEAAY